MKFTHKINWMGKELKVSVFDGIKADIFEGQVYVRTEDGRCCWWPEDKLIKLKD